MLAATVCYTNDQYRVLLKVEANCQTDATLTRHRIFGGQSSPTLATPSSWACSDVAADFGPMVVDSLDELFANAAAYSNKAVVVRGTIVTQCISGCTFSLEDGTGVIGVELIDDALDHVLDGGSIGRLVEVRGTVEVSPHLAIVIEDPEDWNYLD